MLDDIHEYLCKIHCSRLFLNTSSLYGVSCVTNLFCSIPLWSKEADVLQLYSAGVPNYLILPSFSISARPANL
jgi:hypothetical protein